MQGAFYTGRYRNVFLECGYNQREIEEKLNQTFQTMFYGTEEERIYHQTGDDMGYLEDTGNHDVRTEGMSYGMMICVQMDKKAEFDRIWKWVRTYMYMEQGENAGYFAWSCQTDGKKNAWGAAPDGEEFFAMALFFASNRWGDGSGIYCYSKEAREILHTCIHKGEDGIGKPMWEPSNYLIKFIAECDFSDPSYHLPHFYELFALWANEEDRVFWKRAAKASREYLECACHKDTGLCGEYAEYDGTPRNGLAHMTQRHDWYYSDAYRTIANIGLDYEWFREEVWECDRAEKLQEFYCSKGDENGVYLIDGTPLEETALHPVAVIATNAQASLAAPKGKNAAKCVEKFWNTPLRQGERRYYDNFLYMFALLALSGNYRIWQKDRSARVEKISVSNPVLKGFYPDPSVCRAGEYFYLVNSSFAYFPGIPVFRSRNLAQWEQIGNALDRESQLPLKGCGHSDGIYAPTIRFYKDTFYIITTNVSGGGNFVITAKDPAGPWSEPYYLRESAPGIDPSLFWDDDGTCYYVGTRPRPKGVRYNGDWEVWIQKLDIDSMQLYGESKRIWKGAMHYAIWPEGPHLYKRGDWYYIMAAEGGTSRNHCITIGRSRNPEGPYVGNPNNPILTHRHLGSEYPVVNVGHGDLIEDKNGNWYMLLLASRTWKGYNSMGRETFLAEVVWEEDWPVVSPGTGKLKETITLLGEPEEFLPEKSVYHFVDYTLDMEFVMLRNPDKNMYSLTEREGFLRLALTKENLQDKASPSYIALRQQSFCYQSCLSMEFEPEKNMEAAGMAVLFDDRWHIRMEKVMVNQKLCLRLVYCLEGKEEVLAVVNIEAGNLILKMVNKGLEAAFYYKMPGKEYVKLADKVDMHFLSTEAAGGFTGATIGMFASSNGEESKNYADFQWFSLENI